MADRRQSLLAAAEATRWEVGEEAHEGLTATLYDAASRIAGRAVRHKDGKPRFDLDSAIDRLVTNRWLGFPLMLLMLAVVFWITVEGANIPSQLIASLLVETFHPALKNFAGSIGLPWWLSGVLIDGAYLAMAWVVSVMLPPMAVFFPLFTLLEDFGYLPRVAFNLDSVFRKAGAHGKQALTMTMGFGCNAAGVIATRIIDSPRERLIAIITNNFSLCNGRWPTQVLIASIFLGSLVPPALAGLASAGAVVSVAVGGILFSLATSWSLSRTVLKGIPSAFSLELPPYRPPQILRTLYTSLIDRTVFVLWRAILFAVPAGVVIWLVANVEFGGISIATHVVEWWNPVAFFLGLNGVILLAYVIAIPANEIVIPTVLMLTVHVLGLQGVGGGTGVNLMLFSLLHNPCSTTIFTIYKETGSAKWTAVATLLPLVLGIVACFFVAQVWRLLAGG